MVSTREAAAPDVEPARPRRMSWRDRLFRPEAEGHLRRRMGDVVRLLIAIGLLVLAARHNGDVTRSEHAVFDLFNTMPASLEALFRALYRVGALWAVALVVVAAVIANRWRLARDLLVAGLLAWLAARAIGRIVVEHEGIAHSVRLAGGSSPSFPAVRLAVTVAIISAAAPYLSRPFRWFGWSLVGALGVSAMYLGTAFPNDLFGGVVLGLAAASFVHLAFGSPGARPTVPQVVAALRRLGVQADAADLATHQPAHSTVILAADDGGPLRVKVLGRDETETRFLRKLWQTMMYKESGPRLALSRATRVEREAYLMLLAGQAGVHVPTVVVAGSPNARVSLLAMRPVAGSRLSELGGDEVDDALLTRIWESVQAMHRARVVHNDLDADHIIVADGQPWIVGFDNAATTSSSERIAADSADVLAATAAIVGEQRAVAAAVKTIGRAHLAATLPFLSPAALSSSTRHLAGDRRREVRELLERLRVAGAEALGIEPPEPMQLRRITFASAAMAIGALVAIAVLLTDVGDPADVADTLRGAHWGWLLFALALSFISNVAYAVALQGTVPIRLPLWPTTEVQVAMSFSNLAVPAIGGQGMQVRFLQKMGLDLSSAVAAGGILSAFGALASAAGLFTLALIIEPAHVDLSLIPTNGLLTFLVVVAIVLVIASVVIALAPRVRGAVMPPLTRAVSTVWTVVRSPQRLALLLGGNVMATLLSTWCLQACLIAFDGHVSFWALLAANIGVVTIASIVPLPGGGTAVGTVGLSAVLVSFGVSRDVAVASVLANQLAFYYLPAVPGWFATRHLARLDYL
jgi:uncharacterized membrane protein YbhN (UPF0104 family)/tRNA A-37 threonylcarbamoyl transferase component Bud32